MMVYMRGMNITHHQLTCIFPILVNLKVTRIMQSLKREFLKKWLMGLQKCSPSEEKMSLLERKKAIKLSADLAMASTRRNHYRRTTSWAQALISKATKDTETGFLAKRILGSGQPEFSAQTHYPKSSDNATRRSRRKVGIVHHKKKKIMKKTNGKVRARAIAKRLVKKRTQVLKGLVPGGEAMDEYSLIKEALDYIVALRAQVDVMHHLANSAQLQKYN